MGYEYRAAESGLMSGLRAFEMTQNLLNAPKERKRQTRMDELRIGLAQAQTKAANAQVKTAANEQERLAQLRNAQSVLHMIQVSQEQGIDLADMIRNPQKYQPAFKTADLAFTGQIPSSSPEVAKATNVIFGGRVNRGEGGSKTFAGWYPAQDGQTLYADLSVETEKDGKTLRHNAPMTNGRGNDDTVMAVPVDKLARHVKGRQLIFQGLQLPQVRAMVEANILRLGGELPSADFDPETISVQKGGETVTYIQQPGGGLKEIGRGPKWNPQRGTPDSPDDRYIVSGGQLYDVINREWIRRPDTSGDQRKLAAKMAGDMLKAQGNMNYGRGPAEGEGETYQQLYDKAMAILVSDDNGKGETRAGDKDDQAGGNARADKAKTVIIADHPSYGDVTEADIQATMKAQGMSRAEVMEALGQ